MTAETVVYTTLIGDDEPIEELPADIIDYGFRLNRPGHLHFTLPVDHPKCRSSIIWPGVHEAVVTRNRQVVWRGPVLTARETERTVEFGCEGLLAYLRRWYVTDTLTYTDKDLAVIARALIDHHQGKAGGDFGIDTTGTETTRTATRTYFGYELKNVYDAVIELAEVDDGFDFEISPETRRFIAHYPQAGTRTPNLLWEDGILRFARDVDATGQASQILAVGEGEGDSMLRISRQSSSAVASYGLTQAIHTAKTVSLAATLLDHAAGQLTRFAEPSQTVTVTVGGDVACVLGDEGRLVYPSAYEAVSEYRRLVGLDVTWERGTEHTTLQLEPI